MTTPSAAGQRFIGSCDFYWMADIAKILKQGLGAKARKVPSISVPDFLVRVIAIFDPVARGGCTSWGSRDKSRRKRRAECWAGPRDRSRRPFSIPPGAFRHRGWCKSRALTESVLKRTGRRALRAELLRPSILEPDGRCLVELSGIAITCKYVDAVCDLREYRPPSWAASRRKSTTFHKPSREGYPRRKQSRTDLMKDANLGAMCASRRRSYER
jgi:hypothetical protein